MSSLGSGDKVAMFENIITVALLVLFMSYVRSCVETDEYTKCIQECENKVCVAACEKVLSQGCW